MIGVLTLLAVTVLAFLWAAATRLATAARLAGAKGVAWVTAREEDAVNNTSTPARSDKNWGRMDSPYVKWLCFSEGQYVSAIKLVNGKIGWQRRK
jgi:hypothetical protein